MRKWKKPLIWIMLPITVCAVMFLGEVLFQYQLLLLPAEQKGTVSLPLSGDSVIIAGEPIEVYEEEYDEEDYWDEDYGEEEAAEDTTPALSLSGSQTATILYNGYISHLILRSNDIELDGKYTISGTDAEGNTFTVSSYFGGGTTDGFDAVLIDRSVSSLTLSFAESRGGSLLSIEAANTFCLNPYRMLFTGLCALGLYLLLALRKVIARRAEIGFLIIALCAGIFMCVCLPANTGVSFDDEVHYGRIILLSRGHSSGQTEAEARMVECGWNIVYDNGYHHIWDTWLDQQKFAAQVEAVAADSSLRYEETLQWQFSDTGYVIQAAGAALGRALGLPFLWQMRLIRMFNMLTYVLLIFLAISKLKRFKLTMAAVALTPTPMFLACNFTYDTTTNALCFLGTALLVDAILDRQKPLSLARGLTIVLALLLGSISKVVYMPLLLLVLLLPRSKFSSNAARIWFKCFSVALCVAAVLSMVISVNVGTTTLQDSRGDGADVAAQIAYLLHHPFAYLITFFKTLWDDFSYYFITSARNSLGYLSGFSGTLATLSVYLTVFTAATDHDPSLGQALNWKQRLFMLIIGMMTVGMVFTTMYVAGTAVGADYFWGVQGRYLIPVIPLLLMLISPDTLHNRMNKTGWHLFFFLANGLILGSVCFSNILSCYWL